MCSSLERPSHHHGGAAHHDQLSALARRVVSDEEVSVETTTQMILSRWTVASLTTARRFWTRHCAGAPWFIACLGGGALTPEASRSLPRWPIRHATCPHATILIPCNGAALRDPKGYQARIDPPERMPPAMCAKPKRDMSCRLNFCGSLESWHAVDQTAFSWMNNKINEALRCAIFCGGQQLFRMLFNDDPPRNSLWALFVAYYDNVYINITVTKALELRSWIWQRRKRRMK